MDLRGLQPRFAGLKRGFCVGERGMGGKRGILGKYRFIFCA